MAFDLCRSEIAAHPFYMETTGLYIYSIEELCYYLYENVYLVDESVASEALCDWIRDELEMKKLYKTLYDLLEKEDHTAAFIMAIFKETGYLDTASMRTFQENLSRLSVQPDDTRAKLKGDYLVRCGIYSAAVSEYSRILKNQSQRSLGASFYSEVLTNMGCAYARLMRFDRAGDCFIQSWKLVHSKENLRRAVSVLPFYLEGDEYQHTLDSLGADPELLRTIQDYIAELLKNEEKAETERPSGLTHEEEIAQIKESYRRSANCPL